MKQYRTVKEFLDKIKDKYADYRAEYDRLSEILTAKQEQWKNEVKRGWNTRKMHDEAESQYKAETQQIISALEALRKKADTEFNTILENADNVFGRYNRATGDKLDLATVELLKSGILTDNEIKALADDFKGNVAMLRILGKYADERAVNNTEMSTLAHTLNNAEIAYREPLETLITFGMEGISRNKIKSYAYDKNFEGQYNSLVESNKDVYITIED